MATMNFPAGHVALVTGAAGGIGAATARRFAEAGADVVISDVTESVHDLAKTLASVFPDRKFHSVICDVADEASAQNLIAETKAKFGRLDHVALVAGIVQKIDSVENTTYAEWRRVFGINIDGAFLVSKAAIPLLRASKSGTIVTVSSVWGQSGRADFAAYCSSKAAHSGFIQSLASELAPAIRVNAVAPGHVKTAMHEVALQQMSEEWNMTKEEVRAQEWGHIPMKDAGDPAALADSIVYLSSPASAYVTGTTLDVNGGLLYR
ncbi:SDR family NAD(P)-dependent oxidoreductase [Pseudomonas sp. NPDC089401]|uniref:SDR family NAD(P)-dependent oxidoreductase n=1 Tax=Pseudomonas sp. NPDC089401 TaxID=3364462 RepID=UPI003819F620